MHKKSCLHEHFLPTSPRLFITRNSLQLYIVCIRLNYKATYSHKIICTKIGNKSFNPVNINLLTHFRLFKVPKIRLDLWLKFNSYGLLTGVVHGLCPQKDLVLYMSLVDRSSSSLQKEI